MDPAEGEGGQSPSAALPPVSFEFTGDEEIAEARDLSRSFLISLRDEHGRPVSEQVIGMVQLVVSELVTNAYKHAPGPGLLTLEATEGGVEVTVWDSEPRLPGAQAPDPDRVGQHGLEIVMALCQRLEAHREPVGKRITAVIPLP